MTGTVWSLLPAIVAISLTLITKDVYMSLFFGIIIGGLLFSSFSIPGAVDHIFNDGIVASLSDSYNVGILVFLVALGIMVALMNKSGGSRAFGEWAEKHIRTKAGAQLATVLLGILIFIDDYFNCLTVGSVMRPVTDRCRVPREKLAYLIDSTAAPVCIIAPVSSWAAAVSGFVDGEDGFLLFVKAIPYNFYALFTMFSVIALSVSDVDFGEMKKCIPVRPESEKNESGKKGGSVFNLVLPIVYLIVFCIGGMIYSGGFYKDGETKGSFVKAFAASDASVGLMLGAVFAVIVTVLLFTARRVMKFRDCMDCIPDGFKAMVPAILILTLAWTLKGMTDSLGAKEFVAGLVSSRVSSMMMFLPAIVFVIAGFLAFSTGTSWGTFGILIPIVVTAFGSTDYNLMILAISSCMAGAVWGDHCSPISDTTIMASAGAACDHLRHVSTQFPYASFVALISFLSYIVAGVLRSPVVPLAFGFAVIGLTVFIFKKRSA